MADGGGLENYWVNVANARFIEVDKTKVKLDHGFHHKKPGR